MRILMTIVLAVTMLSGMGARAFAGQWDADDGIMALLEQATDYYEQGRIQDMPGLLSREFNDRGALLEGFQRDISGLRGRTARFTVESKADDGQGRAIWEVRWETTGQSPSGTVRRQRWGSTMRFGNEEGRWLLTGLVFRRI